MKRGPLAIVLGVGLAVAPDAAAAVWYIDYEGGDDSQAGQSEQTAWKHSPGDAQAKGRAASGKLQPGDVVRFKGGVRYSGSISIPASGSAGREIKFEGDSGWGDGPAIIDGARPLELTRGTGNGMNAGEVPHPSYHAIYWGKLPPGADWKVPVLESGELLQMAQRFPNPQPFFYQDTEFFKPLRDGLTKTSCRDPRVFTEPDATFWVGAQILVHVTGNAVNAAEILAYDPRSATVTFGPVGTPYSDGNWDQSFHYSLVNSPRLINGPGQYAVDVRRRLVFVWPRANAKLVRAGHHPYAFHTNGQSHVTIRGFTIEGQYSAGFVHGRAITGSSDTPTNGVVIAHCRFRNLGGPSSGATYLFGAGGTENSVEDCTFEYIRGRGPFVTGRKIAVRNNTIRLVEGTCIYSQNHSRGPNADGEISGNVIKDCRGVHQNGITVYGGAGGAHYAENWKIFGNRVEGLDHRYGNFALSLQGHRNLLVYNNVFSAAGGIAGDELAPGSEYIRFYNNTVTGKVRLFGLANTKAAAFMNNICAGLTVSDGGSSGPVRWSRLQHGHNAYTDLYFTQSNNTGWRFSAGDVRATAAKIIRGGERGPFPAGPAIDAGADLSEYFSSDLAGTRRPQGRAWDIGALELPSEGGAMKTGNLHE